VLDQPALSHLEEWPVATNRNVNPCPAIRSPKLNRNFDAKMDA
jgi:hypothetical protein